MSGVIKRHRLKIVNSALRLDNRLIDGEIASRRQLNVRIRPCGYRPGAVVKFDVIQEMPNGQHIGYLRVAAFGHSQFKDIPKCRHRLR